MQADGLREVEGHVLPVQPLFAKFEKLNFSGEVFPHQVFGLLRYGRLVNVSVEGAKVLHVLCKVDQKETQSVKATFWSGENLVDSTCML